MTASSPLRMSLTASWRSSKRMLPHWRQRATTRSWDFTKRNSGSPALASSDAYDRAKATADAWCAAVLQRKIAGAPRITTGVVRRLAIGDETAFSEVKLAVRICANRYSLFQWEVEFPVVFAGDDPGFDVVLGNPPWDQLIFQEREFFAARSPEIAAAGRAAQRQKLIESL